MERYDVAIVGSGPAGLQAAVDLKIRKRAVILFGPKEFSRKLVSAPRVENYLGFPGTTGRELQQRFAQHLEEMGIGVQNERVQVVYPMGGYFSIATPSAVYEATAVLLATGAFAAKPLEGELEYLGKGVGYCASCDAALYKGKTVAILAYTDEAAEEAEFVAGFAGKTYYLPMRKEAGRPGGEIEVLEEKAIGVQGDTAVRNLRLTGRDLPVDGVFILRESLAPDSLLTGIALQDGFIRVDAQMTTSIEGCFAAGDCTGKPHQFMRAAGQGQVAAHSIATYLSQRNKQ